MNKQRLIELLNWLKSNNESNIEELNTIPNKYHDEVWRMSKARRQEANYTIDTILYWLDNDKSLKD